MFYVRVPLSRQIFISMLILTLIAIGSIYITQKNISVIENNNKITTIQKNNSFYLLRSEEKQKHLMRDMVTNLLYDLPYHEMPGLIGFFEWNDDYHSDLSVRREADNFTVPDEFIDEYKKNVLTTNPTHISNNLYCSDINNCTFFIHKRYSMNGHTGIAIFGIQLDQLISEYKQITDLSSLVFIDNHSQSLNDWQQTPLPKNPHIITLNISKFDKSGNLTDANNIGEDQQLTNLSYINKFADTWNFEQKIYTKFHFLGEDLGYIVSFIPKNNIVDILLLPTPENFFRMLFILVILGGAVLYHFHILFKAYVFMDSNRNRIKRYAPTAHSGFAQDEMIILTNMLDSAITTAEKQALVIEKQNKKLALFDSYDSNSSLPNAKWLRDQLNKCVNSFAEEQGYCYYLVLFTTSLSHKFLTENNNLAFIASKILKAVGENNYLAMFDEQTFGVITTNCSNHNEVCHLLEKIKQSILINIPTKEQNFYINAGIVSIISRSLTNGELIRRAQSALQNCINEKTQTDNYTIYSDSMASGINENTILETNLRRARTNGELMIKYDVIYNLKNHDVAGLNSHTYWIHNGTEIPLSECRNEIIKYGLNIEYNYWQIESCLFDLNELDSKLGRQINIVINLNFGQLTDPKLISTLDILTQKYTIMPSRIYFAITEEEISCDIDATIYAINGLIASGYKVSLDNYGQGYADSHFVHKFNFASVAYSAVTTKLCTKTEYDRYMIAASIKQIKDLGTTLVAAHGIDNILTAKTMEAAGISYITGPILPYKCQISQLLSSIDSIKL